MIKNSITLALCLWSTFAAAQFAIFQTKGTVPYEGITATRSGGNWSDGALDTGNKQIMIRSTHVARDTISAMKLVSSNFYVRRDTLVEAAPGAATTVTASIEYPAATCTQVRFSSSASGTIPDGSTLTSDAVTVAIPQGATFYVRQYQTNSAGTIYTTQFNTMASDAVRLGVSGVPDQTVSCGTITSVTANALQFPLALVSTTRNPSVCIFGDSIAWGRADTSTGDIGLIAPSIGPLFGYSNVAVPADEAVAFLASNTQRKKIMSYCSHGIVEYGSNDFALAGRTLAQVKADLTSIYALFSGQGVFQTTILPRPSTTDACATNGNQTLPSWEASRTSLNDQLRAGSFGSNSGMFDASNTVETSLNSGKWKITPSWSDDCIHPNTFGYGQVTSSGVINTSRITR